MEKIINNTCKIYIDDGYRNFQKSLCEVCKVDYVDELNKIYDNYDIILTPNGGSVAPKLDEANDDRLSDEYLILENHLALGNFAGTPSISIPSGFSEGMPIAINLMGRLFEEQTVFNVAYALEQALGFANQYSRKG